MSSSRVPLELQTARYQLASSFPYFSSAVMGLTFIPDERVPTIATDTRWRCYFNPEFIARCSPEEVNGLLMHEIQHLLRNHAARSGRTTIDTLQAALEHLQWNIAGDMEINDDEGLFTGKFVLPKGAWYPSTIGAPNGKLAEEYYELLEEQKQQQKGQGGTGGGKHKAPPGKHPHCGSCAHGEPEEYERPESDPDAPGRGAAEAELTRRQVAKDIQSHIKANGIGSVPAGIQRWADELLSPTVPWQEVLKGELRASIAGAGHPRNWTYRRPSRRQLPGIILPATQKYAPSIAMGIDTSGSMGDGKVFSQALGEVQGIIQHYGMNSIPVIAGDAEVGSARVVKDARYVNLVGGGGTDMRVLLRKMEDMGVDVAVLYTDGYTPWPDEALRCKTIVLCTTDEQCPSWATVVRIPL